MDEALSHWGERNVKGEIVLLLSPPSPKLIKNADSGGKVVVEAGAIDPIEMVKEMIDNGISPALAAKLTSTLLKIKKSQVYKLAVDYAAESKKVKS